LCVLNGWPDNASYQNLLAWCWRKDKERRLIVINCSDARSQGRVRLPWEDLGDRIWQLEDLFSDSIYEREGKEMTEPGLFVDLDPWGFHYLKF
ncbi:MAG: alpha-amylase, partial [Euryarchaeota archaeon]|nr:alpha-amylase [Euryarchaeota archaeon]